MVIINRTLDWVSHHDPKSRNFGIIEKIGYVEPVKKYWTPGAVLNQGTEGACVGFGWTGEGLASPMPFSKATAQMADTFAFGVYYRCKEFDGYPGEEGTSVIAGAKVMQERGYIGSYRWAFGVEQLRSAVISEGPAVIGIPWLEDMYDTLPGGLVTVGGQWVGGHCLVITGYNPRARIPYQKGYHEVFRWQNSWGPYYGVKGQGYIKIDDLALLLANDGEACIPQQRSRFRF